MLMQVTNEADRDDALLLRADYAKRDSVAIVGAVAHGHGLGPWMVVHGYGALHCDEDDDDYSRALAPQAQALGPHFKKRYHRGGFPPRPRFQNP